MGWLLGTKDRAQPAASWHTPLSWLGWGCAQVLKANTEHRDLHQLVVFALDWQLQLLETVAPKNLPASKSNTPKSTAQDTLRGEISRGNRHI